MIAGVEIAGLAAALALSVLSVAVVMVHAQVVARSPSAAAPRLLQALRAAPHFERAQLLASRAEPGTWEHDLAEEVTSAPPGDARAAAIDGALSEIEGPLLAHRGWSDAAPRLALFGALLGASIAAVAENVLPALGALTIGFAGAAASAALARRARASEAAQRRLADDLATALAGGPVGKPRGLDRGGRAR